jgi:hypothetical protein
VAVPVWLKLRTESPPETVFVADDPVRLRYVAWTPPVKVVVAGEPKVAAPLWLLKVRAATEEVARAEEVAMYRVEDALRKVHAEVEAVPSVMANCGPVEEAAPPTVRAQYGEEVPMPRNRLLWNCRLDEVVSAVFPELRYGISLAPEREALVPPFARGSVPYTAAPRLSCCHSATVPLVVSTVEEAPMVFSPVPPEPMARAVPRVRVPVDEKFDWLVVPKLVVPWKYAVEVAVNCEVEALVKFWVAVHQFAFPRLREAMTLPLVGEMVRDPLVLETDETPVVRQFPLMAKQPAERFTP